MANKIGIAITTTPNRKEHLKLCLRQMDLYLPDHTRIFVHNDTQGIGIAKSKNVCLQALADCDYIFLFDDDCFPTQKGWEQVFIEAHLKTNQHHFCYLNRSHQLIEEKENVCIYRDCGGCLMFLTKEVLNKVGGYYQSYLKYGFEHAGYSQRIYTSGLNSYAPYICPANAKDFIYSLDLDLPRFDIKHHRSIPTKQALKHISDNLEFYKEDVKEVYRAI